MLSYIFKESSYSIQKYGTAGDCAQLMYNNFTNDKNDKINIDVLEELKEKYINASSFTTGLLIIFRVQSIAMWQIIMILIAMK